MGAVCCTEPETRTDNEVNFKKLNDPNVRPAPQQAAPRQAPELTKARDDLDFDFDKGFALEIQWNCTLDGKEVHIPIDKLIFSYTACQFVAKGTDEKGAFKVTGRIALNGEVRMRLAHSQAQFGREFRGKFVENVIAGECKDAAGHMGTFKLELISTVWKSANSFVALKSLNEAVGFGCFAYGYAVFSGTPRSEDSVQLNLVFADGKSGLFSFKTGEESISGKVESPNGAEDIVLALKNEF